jgi:hypothetical protein
LLHLKIIHEIFMWIILSWLVVVRVTQQLPETMAVVAAVVQADSVAQLQQQAAVDL